MTLSYRCSNCGTELMTTNADQYEKVMRSLQETFGHRPDERGGEKWTVYQDHSLIVVHPERRPRIYKRGCGGVYYEIEPAFP